MRRGGRTVLKPRKGRGHLVTPGPPAPPIVTNPGLQIGKVGDVVSLAVKAANATSYSVTGLPPTLSIGAISGVIAGTLTTAANFTPTVTVVGPGGTAEATWEWHVEAVPVAPPPPPPPPPPEETGEDERFAHDSYALLEPLAAPDAANNYALRALCRAIGSMWSQVEVMRTYRGKDAWRRPFDVDTSPPWLLPFLGLFVGEQVAPSASEADKRQQVGEEGNIKRGRPSQMISAVERTLTGSKRVRLVERAGSPWRMLLVTATAETPNPALTAAAAQMRKPGGIILTVEVSDLPLIDEGTREIDAATTHTIDTATLADVT